VSFLRRSAYIYPDKIAVVHGDRRYSYRQFEERVDRLASRLRADGLRKHEMPTVQRADRTARQALDVYDALKSAEEGSSEAAPQIPEAPPR